MVCTLATFTKYLLLHLLVHWYFPQNLLHEWFIFLKEENQMDLVAWTVIKRKKKGLGSSYLRPSQSSRWHVVLLAFNSSANSIHAQHITSPPCVRENYANPMWKKAVSNHSWHLISKPGRKPRVAFCLSPNEIPLVKWRSLKIWVTTCCILPLNSLENLSFVLVEDMKYSSGKNPVCTIWNVSSLTSCVKR